MRLSENHTINEIIELSIYSGIATSNSKDTRVKDLQDKIMHLAIKSRFLTHEDWKEKLPNFKELLLGEWGNNPPVEIFRQSIKEIAYMCLEDQN